MESYKNKIAPKKEVELIHLSLDLDINPATKWAEKHGMIWPTILMSDIDQEAFVNPYFEADPEVPSYILIDATGKIISKGKAQAFAKIEMLPSRN